MKRFTVAFVSFAAAVTVSACGGASTSAPVSAAWNKADGRLVRRTLGEQVSALRRGQTWHIIGRTETQFSLTCPASAPAQTDLTADASSPEIYYHSLQLWVEDYLYLDALAAKRASLSLASKGAEACIEQFLVDELQKPYQVGTAGVNAPKSVRAGTEARAAQSILRITYKGQVFRDYLDSVFAREGRAIVEVVATAPEVAQLSYDVKLTQWITQLASTEHAANAR
jgi:hypothetical protein